MSPPMFIWFLVSNYENGWNPFFILTTIQFIGSICTIVLAITHPFHRNATICIWTSCKRSSGSVYAVIPCIIVGTIRVWVSSVGCCKIKDIFGWGVSVSDQKILIFRKMIFLILLHENSYVHVNCLPHNHNNRYRGFNFVIFYYYKAKSLK